MILTAPSYGNNIRLVGRRICQGAGQIDKSEIGKRGPRAVEARPIDQKHLQSLRQARKDRRSERSDFHVILESGIPPPRAGG